MNPAPDHRLRVALSTIRIHRVLGYHRACSAAAGAPDRHTWVTTTALPQAHFCDASRVRPKRCCNPMRVSIERSPNGFRTQASKAVRR